MMNKKITKKSRRKKICFFTKNKVDYIDYKEYEFLSNYVNINKKIITRKITGTSTHYQKKLAKAIKRARLMALMPYSNKQD